MSLLLGWGNRVRRWPKFTGTDSPDTDDRCSAIKVVTTEGLEELMALALRTPGASAAGRPEWLEEHRAELGAHYVVTYGPQREHYLCLVISELAGEPAGFYRLDIPRRTFHALPDISPARLVTFARRHLTAPGLIPPDPSVQRADDDFLRGLDDH
jgi:hypothetical protein